MNPLKAAIIWTLGVLVLLGIGAAFGWAWRDFQCEIPTVTELQEALIDMGYDLGPTGADGVCGPLTEAAWNRAICQRYALKSYAKMPKGE